MYIPNYLVNLIMKYKGAYSTNINKKSFLKNIKYLKPIIFKSLKEAFYEIKEINVIIKYYKNYNNWIIDYYT